MYTEEGSNGEDWAVLLVSAYMTSTWCSCDFSTSMHFVLVEFHNWFNLTHYKDGILVCTVYNTAYTQSDANDSNFLYNFELLSIPELPVLAEYQSWFHFEFDPFNKEFVSIKN